MTEMLTAALAYALAGVAVLPLHTPDSRGLCSCRHRDCDSVGKHPRTEHGLTDASTDLDAIGRWWRLWPDANVGGVVPDGYSILDADTRDVELVPTLCASTGRGSHNWYTTHNGTRAQGRPGVDVRHASANYVVLPPSLHASGVRYAWDDAFDLAAAVPLPAEWTEPATVAEPVSGERFALPDAIEEGKRNKTLLAYGGALRRELEDDGLVRAALEDANRSRCRPPLDARELDTLTRSVLRYQPTPSVILDLRDEPEAETAEPGRTLAERLGVQRIGDMDAPEPAPLRSGLLAENEPNLVYGPGDTGKGAIAAVIVAGEAAAGGVVLVLDYEGHKGEWVRRLQGLGAGSVLYLTPLGTPSLAGPLWKRVKLLRDLCAELAVTLVVVDSVSYACAGFDVAKDATVPPLYFGALQAIGRTSLTLAHVTKADERWPRHPFGSVHWHTGTRMAWAAEKVDDDPHTVELRCRKHNDYPPQPDRTYALEWDGSRLTGATVRTNRRSLIARLAEAMRDGAWLTTREATAAVSDDGGDPVTEYQVGELLRRYRARGRFESSGGRPLSWRLTDTVLDLEADK